MLWKDGSPQVRGGAPKRHGGQLSGLCTSEILLLRGVFSAKPVAELPWCGAALRSPCSSVAPQAQSETRDYILCGLGFFLSLIVFWTLALYAKRSLPRLSRLGGIFCSWRGGQAVSGWVLGTGDSWLGGRSEKMRWRTCKLGGIWRMRGNNILLSIFPQRCLNLSGQEGTWMLISDPFCAPVHWTWCAVRC